MHSSHITLSCYSLNKNFNKTNKLEFKVTITNFMDFSEYFLQRKKTNLTSIMTVNPEGRKNPSCAGTALDTKLGIC